MMPRITTTGLFDTVFNQLGNYTFTLPSAPGTLATTANVATETTRATAAEGVLTTAIGTETTRATAAEGVNATAISTETTNRTAADAAEVTARNTAIGVETSRATTAEALLAPKASPPLTGTPTAPTAAPGTNTTQVATTAFSAAAVLVETNRATTAEGTNATAITTETTRATAAEAAGLLAGSENNGRNRIDNGGFRVNQRTYVSTTALAAGVYAHDRWKAGAAGCTYTFTQTQPATTITITAGTLVQVVESVDVEGGTFILSWTGTAVCRVNAGLGLASPITVTGLPANTAITIEFGTGTLGTVQLEPGSVASAFERKPLQIELAKCQRYYQTGAIVYYGAASAGGQTLANSQPLPVTMRAAPTCASAFIVTTNTSGQSVSNAGTASAVQVIAASVAGGQFSLSCTFTASADL